MSSTHSNYQKHSSIKEYFNYATYILYFMEIPGSLPYFIRGDFTHGLFLLDRSFVYMISYALFYALFRRTSPAKEYVVNRFRTYIRSNYFISGQHSIKEYLLKCLGLMQAHGESIGSPIASMLTKECFDAFSGCWLEIISAWKLSKGQKYMEVLTELFRMFGEMFYLVFHLNWKNYDTYYCYIVPFNEQQYNQYYLKSISLIIIPKTFSFNNPYPQSFTEVALKHNWNYFILFKQQQYYHYQYHYRSTPFETSTIDRILYLPEDETSPYLSSIDIHCYRIKDTTRKGMDLMASMLMFLDELETFRQ